MKYLILFFGLIAFSAPKTNNLTQVLFEFSNTKQTLKQSDIQSEKLFSKLPIINTKEKAYLPFIGILKDEFVDDHNLRSKFKIGSQTGKVITIYVTPDQISELQDLEELEILKISEKIDPPTIAGAITDSRVNYVHNAFNLDSAYTGEGVLLGIIDGGFDYTHPNFYNDNFDKYRVAAAWDQRTPGTPPEGFEFGNLYDTQEELLNVKRDSEDIQDTWGTHGTHVAGIAGGTGGGSEYRGVAYEADFLFCTRRDDEAGNYDAYNWMAQKAKELGKRLVINMSYGGIHRGTNDGSSEIGMVITELTNQGVVFVGSAGNNGAGDFHLSHEFNSDTIRTNIAKSGGQYWGNRIVMIGEQDKQFGIALEIRDLNDNSTIINETQLFRSDDQINSIDTNIVIDSDTISYRLLLENEDPFSGRSRIDLFVENEGIHKIVIKAYSEDATVHFWNVAERETRTTNRGYRFTTLNGVENAVGGDNHYSLGEPGSNNDVITTAAHSHYDRELTSFSSEGPRIDGTIKPDISAPGYQVISSIALFVRGNYQNVAGVEFEEEVYTFAALSGTSMSAPVVAGVCALILEANPELTPREVKSILKATAYQDEFTGEIPEEYSTEWGAGKVDAIAAIYDILDIVASAEIDTQNDIIIYPNPSTDKIKLIGVRENQFFRIFDINGIEIKNGILMDEIKVADLQSGTYFISINNKDAIKFIKK